MERGSQEKIMATIYARVDESRTQLHRAGWSVGETATAGGWLVTGSNGGEPSTTVTATER
jgi:hypothetical protein